MTKENPYDIIKIYKLEGAKHEKLLSLALALCFVLTLVSCGKKGTSPNTGDSAESFVKPEQYASVLLITINPQFRLYLDEDGKVLAVEAVNKDAESIKDSITFENQSFETVIETIVTTANKNGFVKADATINFEIVESKETDKDQSAILSKAEKMANDTADELKIGIKVEIGEIKTNSTTSASEVTTSSSEATTSNNQSATKPTHTHSFSAATCTEPKKCSCGAVEGKALGHKYKDGVCTRCKAKDPNYKPLTSVLQKKGAWRLQYLQGKQLYSVAVIVCKPGENHASVGIGDPLNTLPSDMQKDPNIKDDCEVYNGEYYYIGMGDGDNLKTVKEDNGTVTLTDSSGNTLVLARTGENTLKCTLASDRFAWMAEIPVGSVFTFVAD